MPDILSKAAMHNAYFICHNVQVKLLSIRKCSTGLLPLNMSKYFLYHICRTWCFTEVLHGMGQGEKEKGKRRNKCKGRKIQESKEWEIALPLWPTILVFQVVHLFQNLIFVSMVTRIWYIIILNMSSVYYNSLFSMLRTSFIYHCISYWGSSLITVVIVLSSYPTQYCTVHYSISYMWVWLGYYSYVLKCFGQKGIFLVLMVSLIV